MSASPELKFQWQRARAKRRGIPWQMTFEQWWAIWSASGLWEKRGRNVGCYVMARNGDAGPYAVGNVSIILHSQNIIDGVTKDRDLPVGVYLNGKNFAAKRHVNGRKRHLGTFPTPELAHAAYLKAAA